MEPIQEALPDFEGKTVVFYSRIGDSTQIIGTISSPRFVTQASRLFVTGEAASTSPISESWVRGADAAVAWEDVCSYLVFESDDFERKAQERWKQRQASKEPPQRGLLRYVRRQ